MVLKFVSCSCTDAEITKSTFFGEKKNIFLQNFDVAEESPRFHIPHRDLQSCMFRDTKLASLIYQMCKMSISIRSIPVSNRKHCQAKKVLFIMKSRICLSRNSSAVKVLKSSDLFNSQPSSHLHTGCFPS